MFPCDNTHIELVGYYGYSRLQETPWYIYKTNGMQSMRDHLLAEPDFSMLVYPLALCIPWSSKYHTLKTPFPIAAPGLFLCLCIRPSESA